MSKHATKLILGALTLAVAACEPSIAVPEEGLEPAGTLAIAASMVDAGPEVADVLNQGGVGVYSEAGAALVRQPNGLHASLTMPTPASGGYVYADGTVAGHPEVFTLWAFVFNYPENCTDPCNGDDLGTATGAVGGAYNVGGVISGGGNLAIAGRIGVGEEPFAFAPLESPATAEVHLAVAPHGAMDPSTLPDELRTPTGSPTCACWWVAILH